MNILLRIIDKFIVFLLILVLLCILLLFLVYFLLKIVEFYLFEEEF